MITNINEFKKYLNEGSNIPDNVELQMGINYENINYNDLEIIDLGGDGESTADLGIHIPGEKNEYNKGIVVEMKIINEVLYLIDITMDFSLQGLGLGYKIYKKIMYEFGNILSLYSKRVNTVEVPKIWNKLNMENDFEVITNEYGQLCILKSLPEENKIELKNNLKKINI